MSPRTTTRSRRLFGVLALAGASVAPSCGRAPVPDNAAAVVAPDPNEEPAIHDDGPLAVYVECDAEQRRFLVAVRRPTCLDGGDPAPAPNRQVTSALLWTAAVVAAASAASQADCEVHQTCFGESGETLGDVVSDAAAQRRARTVRPPEAPYLCAEIPARRLAIHLFDGAQERFIYTGQDGRVAVPARLQDPIYAELPGAPPLLVPTCPLPEPAPVLADDA